MQVNQWVSGDALLWNHVTSLNSGRRRPLQGLQLGQFAATRLSGRGWTLDPKARSGPEQLRRALEQTTREEILGGRWGYTPMQERIAQWDRMVARAADGA
jgi:hypothetical protein